MASLSSTATGHDIHEHVIRIVEKIEVSPVKLCDLTADGASSMYVTALFTKRTCVLMFLAFAEVMKNVVQCVNYIRARGLND